jgi:hypothetical protein
MIDARVLATHPKPASSTPDFVKLFGVWIPRGGDNLRIVFEAVSNLGTNIWISLYHKNRGDAGNGSLAPGGMKLTEPSGRYTHEWAGLKEQVRFWFSLSPGASLSTGQVGMIMYRFLQPVWFESVKA